jgi:molybdopterin converting factor subunit 1
MSPMQVRLLFFAVLRDVAGTDVRELTLEHGTTPRSVWNGLRAEFEKLRDFVEPPMAAVNEEYASADAPLHDGDELAFIPPVAGG